MTDNHFGSAGRTYAKVALVAALLGVVLGSLITFVSRETVNGLRHHLTVWLLLALVAIINIASFLLFLLFRSIYHWIRQDPEPQDDE